METFLVKASGPRRPRQHLMPSLGRTRLWSEEEGMETENENHSPGGTSQRSNTCLQSSPSPAKINHRRANGDGLVDLLLWIYLAF